MTNSEGVADEVNAALFCGKTQSEQMSSALPPKADIRPAAASSRRNGYATAALAPSKGRLMPLHGPRIDSRTVWQSRALVGYRSV